MWVLWWWGFAKFAGQATGQGIYTLKGYLNSCRGYKRPVWPALGGLPS